MKLASFTAAGRASYGLITDGGIVDLGTRLGARYPSLRAALAGNALGEIAERDYLLRALATLPRGQRAVLVLRYFEDLPEAEIARVLGCSVGSVASALPPAAAALATASAPEPSRRTSRVPYISCASVGVR